MKIAGEFGSKCSYTNLDIAIVYLLNKQQYMFIIHKYFHMMYFPRCWSDCRQ